MGHLRTAVLAIVVLLCASPLLAQRLPPGVTPGHYDLAFDVDLENARFSGVERIDVHVDGSQRRIVLNAADIDFDEVEIAAGGTTQRAAVVLDRTAQTATLSVPRPVVGDASISIRYRGTLNNDLRGFYLSKGEHRRYAVTQFEATDARRAFPSFDEPSYKATFSIRLTVAAGDMAISNGPLVSDTPGPEPGRHTLTFAQTPKMSSYLVAMAVGDFACVGDERPNEIPIRVCATPDKAGQRAIALDAARQILTYLNGYYAIPYAFGKLDLLAVPDFAAGAMENTGAIFFRETDLLADQKTASIGNVKRIWTVIAHEMAHQWFGDLVTMQWWNDLWLNEGFASWMESRPLAALKPEWNMAADDAADTQRAMSLDALPSTRPIRANAETPSDIDAAFDAIAYQKSAAVLRMVEGYVGTEPFRAGVNRYLQAHAYGNATSEDFWQAMTAATGKPVDQVLPAFVDRPGVPLLQVTGDCAANGAAGLQLVQERFTIGRSAAASTTSPPWQVPVCERSTSGGDCELLTTRTQSLACPAGSWVFLNRDARGYYRTQYPTAALRTLGGIAESGLTVPERLSLLGDEWALVRAERHTAADFLTLASGYTDDHSSVVVGELASRLGTIHTRLVAPGQRPAFEQFVRGLFEPLMLDIGFNAKPSDAPETLELRSQVIAALGTIGGDEQVAAQAREALQRALAGTETLEPTVAGALVRVGARHGDARLWEAYERAARTADGPIQRERYLLALPLFEDPALVDRSLALALTDEVRSQDTARYLAAFLLNPAVNARAWAFIKQHWSELQQRVSLFNADTALAYGLSGFCDTATRNDIRQFFSTHKLPSAGRALDQTIETIDSCIALRTTQSPTVARWLDEHR